MEMHGHRVECPEIGKQMFTMKTEVVGQPFVVSDDLVKSFEQKVC
jgi:hypothetical protein